MRHNVSEITELIEDRRTIFPEQFSKRKVHKEIVESLLDAAKWAPTHKLTQPWNFIVYMEEGLRKFADWHSQAYKSSKLPEEFSQKKFDKIYSRPLLSSAVVVVSMKRDEEERIPEIEEVASTAAAVQNMALLATAQGIALYWGTGGMTYSDEIKEFVGLADRDKVMGLLFIGYPAKEWPKKTPRKPREYYSKFIL